MREGANQRHLLMVLPATADDDLCKSRPCPLLLFYQFPCRMKRTNRTDICGTSRSSAGSRTRWHGMASPDILRRNAISGLTLTANPREDRRGHFTRKFLVV